MSLNGHARKKNCTLRTASADEATDIVFGYESHVSPTKGDSGFEISLAGSCQIEMQCWPLRQLRDCATLGYQSKRCPTRETD